MDHELFTAFDGAGGAVRLHFEPARSGTLGDPLPLAWGRDLLDFKPVFKVWDLRTEAVASGTPPRRRGSFSERVLLADAIRGELHAGANGITPLSADDARRRAFSNETHPEAHNEPIAVSNLDEERARLLATATLRRSARQFLCADITTIGSTRLRPGMHVDLSGFHSPFDGIYYVTQTVHTLSAAGYLTVSSLRRPGMLDPSRYPGG